MGLLLFALIWAGIVYVATPVALVYGWLRIRPFRQRRLIWGWFAFSGQILAMASAMLAAGAIICGGFRGGWPYGDPSLMRFYAWGMLISSGALLCSLAGIWGASALRWWAPVASFGMLLFWCGAAMTE